jgi:hypothetical protein
MKSREHITAYFYVTALRDASHLMMSCHHRFPFGSAASQSQIVMFEVGFSLISSCLIVFNFDIFQFRLRHGVIATATWISVVRDNSDDRASDVSMVYNIHEYRFMYIHTCD